MSDLTAADILDKAADHVEKYGWIQEDWYWPFVGGEPLKDPMECAVCAGGGINAGGGFVPDYEPDGTEGALCEAQEAFAEYVSPGYDAFRYDALSTIAGWNDRHDRTASEVVTALRSCAADLRKGAK